MSFFEAKKPKRRLVTLVPTSPKAADDPRIVQEYYDNLSTVWFNTDSLLWNFTINPDPKITCNSKGTAYKKATPVQARTFLHAQIVQILSRFRCKQLIHLEGFVIYYEFGEKNGRFHANLTTKWSPRVDSSMKWYVRTELQKKFGTSHFAVDLKDHSGTMKRPDSYNPKDARVMASYGYKPHGYTVTPYIPIP